MIKLLLIPLVVLLVSCGEDTRPSCKFKEGDIVLSVLSNQRGQVYIRYDYTCRYKVRFKPGAETEYFKEFELKHEKESDNF